MGSACLQHPSSSRVEFEPLLSTAARELISIFVHSSCTSSGTFDFNIRKATVMSDGHDEAVRIVYDEDNAGGVEEHGHTAPLRRETLQALLSAQMQHEDSTARASFAKGRHQGPATRCHEPLEEHQGAAQRSPLPAPRSPLLQHDAVKAAANQNQGEIAATAPPGATHLSAIPLQPKPTHAELKAEIAASKPHRYASAFCISIYLFAPIVVFMKCSVLCSAPYCITAVSACWYVRLELLLANRSEKTPQRQRYRTPQHQRTNNRFAAPWSNKSSATPISRHVRYLVWAKPKIQIRLPRS